jgi:hypothetical protein
MFKTARGTGSIDQERAAMMVDLPPSHLRALRRPIERHLQDEQYAN